MLHFDSSHSIVTRGFRVSRAPSHHTLPAFLNPNGMFIKFIFNVKLLIVVSFFEIFYCYEVR